MSTSPNSRREHPSTYFVQDRASQDELTRVQIQDQMLTMGMGGVFPEQPDMSGIQRILDIGCGTGGWLIEVAKTYPDLPLLVGIDISSKMIGYAQEQARAAQVSHRVEFHVMDALRLLEFPTDYFDMVNQRLGISYLRTWDWPRLLQEYQRVTRPEGVIRITEAEPTSTSPSEALTRLCAVFLQALYNGGHLFTPEPDGLTSRLEGMMSRYGFVDIQKQNHPIVYRAGTEGGQHFYEDERAFFRNIIPFLRKWTRVPDDYEDLYQQSLEDMLRPDFVATWNLLTIWGTNPPEHEPSLQ